MELSQTHTTLSVPGFHHNSTAAQMNQSAKERRNKISVMETPSRICRHVQLYIHVFWLCAILPPTVVVLNIYLALFQKYILQTVHKMEAVN